MINWLEDNEMFDMVEISQEYPDNTVLGFLNLDVLHDSTKVMIDKTCLYMYKEWLNIHHIPSLADRDSERQFESYIRGVFKQGRREGLTIVGEPNILYVINAINLRETSIVKIDLDKVKRLEMSDEEIKINM